MSHNIFGYKPKMIIGEFHLTIKNNQKNTMKNIIYLLLLTAVGFSACKNESFTRVKDGPEYRIITSKGGKLITTGNIIEMAVLVKYKDSTIFSTYEMGMPQYAPYDTSKFPAVFKEIFKTLHVGDSIIIKESTDSLIKKGQGAPFMKKGDFIYQYYKVLNTYATEEEAEKARAAAAIKAEAIAKKKSEAQLVKDDKILKDYFAKNNIQAVKTPEGAYVQILQKGTGAMLDTSVIAKINYTGRNLEGKMFDSNTDPSKGHLEPLTVNLTPDMSLGNTVIIGMTDGLKMFNKGAKGKIFIPSSLGYGATGSGADIAPNTNLIFEVEVLDVLNKSQAAADIALQQKKMEALQKMYSDSMSKMQPQQQQR